jgi:methylenetetrahydrofolate dehydrogenase (NADP+)/methenyltetrahydrofolate cyclohydrolase
MTQILDGKVARDFYKKALIERVGKLSFVPTLSIIQIGDNKESSIYINQKKKFGESIGVNVSHIHLSENISFEEVSEIIKKENLKKEVSGIIVQLPLPKHLDLIKIINLIDPKKDVDGLTDENQKLLAENKPEFVPATALGVILLLDFYKILISGNKIAVLGRSRLVGSPVAQILKFRGAEVTICHSKTPNTREITNDSDIIISAVGKPNLIDFSYIKNGSVVVDIGGDVNFASVSAIVSAITPFPGGVGPMTVLSLFVNLIEATEKRATL